MKRKGEKQSRFLILLSVTSISSIFLIFYTLLINKSIRTSNRLSQTQTKIPKNGTQTISYVHNGDVWTISDLGENPKQVTHDGNIRDYFWIKNPPGIIYDSIIEGRSKITSGIKILDLTTQIEKTLVSHTYNFDTRKQGGIYPDVLFSFSISPNENILAYDEGFLDDPSQIAIMDMNTGRVRYTHKTGHTIIDSGIVFSPDSQYLAEVPFTGSDYNLKLLSLKDLSLRPLTTKYISPYDQNPKLYGDFLHPHNAVAWSPDGQKFLYYLGNIGAGGLHQSQQIYQFNLGSYTETPITLLIPDSSQYFLDQSSDGNEIFYGVIYDNSIRTLEKTNLVTGKTTSFSLKGEVNHLQVSPQNEPVVFESDEQIWSMSSDGKGLRLIIKEATNPKWVPQ
jgi:hypothetical protein